MADWESNVSIARLISFLKYPIDVISRILSEREFHNKAPLFLVFTHVTSAWTTVAIRHVGSQTNVLNRKITVGK